ncbi:MarR family transcriptional regulator [Desulfitobacterium sp.]|uniref:MarR family winged helix-turn-helix transcriptional regulator n=1 Tax=Desulfitobacterium sp. TaxID=49981 RepID=UPI002D7E79F7|nr:MarR family transcriptional regulator [Desulfitobacterium sp.]
METDSVIHSIGQKYQKFLIPTEEKISLHQFHFLMYLKRQESCTPSEIAKLYDITLGAVTGFVDRLYKLGLITRERSDQDRRLVLIKLSEEGESQLAFFDQRLSTIHQHILNRLGEEEIELLNQHLIRYLQVLDEVSDLR